MYRSILIKLPYLHKLGIDAVQLRAMSRQMVLTDLKLGENVHWYDPGQLIYYST
jgi:glycosidase